MNKYLPLYLVMIVIAIALIIPAFFQKEDLDDENIKRYERLIDSISGENAKLRLIEKSYIVKIDSLSKIAEGNKTEIIYINNRKNEKIRVIDSMSTDSLYNFFSSVKTYYSPSR